MYASLYMCQHPTSVSMYPCPLCQPFGILGCFFLGLEAGASHWRHSHCFFPFSSFFSLLFSNHPLVLPAAVHAWSCAAIWRHDPSKPGEAPCFLGKVVFCCLSGLGDLQKTLISRDLPKKRKL